MEFKKSNTVHYVIIIMIRQHGTTDQANCRVGLACGEVTCCREWWRGSTGEVGEGGEGLGL